MINTTTIVFESEWKSSNIIYIKHRLQLSIEHEKCSCMHALCAKTAMEDNADENNQLAMFDTDSKL